MYFEVAPAQVRGPVAIDLACRDESLDLARDRNRRASRFLADGHPAFKKIDSLLRGHWAGELAVLMSSGLFRTCILAPAFPSQGRTTVAGAQLVQRAGKQERLSIDIEEELSGCGLSLALRSGEEPTIPSGVDVVVCDAQNDDDLRCIVAAGRLTEGPLLWCGSAGLARAMARQRPGAIRNLRSPILAIIGSHHPVIIEQVAHARLRMPDSCVGLTGNAAHDANAIDHCMRVPGRCLATFDLPQGTEATAAAAMIAASLRQTLPRVARPGTLIASGGKTLLSICRSLRVHSLTVEGEWLAGVPGSIMRGGLWDGVRLISKSGAFGNAAVLSDWLMSSAASPRQIGST